MGRYCFFCTSVYLDHKSIVVNMVNELNVFLLHTVFHWYPKVSPWCGMKARSDASLECFYACMVPRNQESEPKRDSSTPNYTTRYSEFQIQLLRRVWHPLTYCFCSSSNCNKYSWQQKMQHATSSRELSMMPRATSCTQQCVNVVWSWNQQSPSRIRMTGK